MMKIVYACNDGYFDGLYLSILSIVRRTKEAAQFFLLSADCTDIDAKYNMFSKEHEDIIRKMVQEFNPENSFQVIDCKNEWIKSFRGGKNDKTKYSPYTSFRLLIDQYEIFNGNVLYIDVDTMACQDISPLFKIDIKDYEFACVIDRLGSIWHGKKCFNAGVMLLNMDNIKKGDLFARALNFVKNRKLFFVDQSALRLAKPNFLYIDKKYNEQKDIIIGETVIKHFCARLKGWPKYNNIKQWDLKNINRIKNINIFDEDYKIYLKNRSSWTK